MYDPKFSIKQMYDQYGSSRTSSSSTTTTAGPRGYTRKSTPAPTPQQRTDRRYVPTNIAAPKSTSRTDRTAPPRAVDYSKGLGSRAFKPETEELSTWEKVKSAFTNTMEKFGIFDEPDTTTTPDAVYKDGNLFSPEPYIPDTSRFEGDTQLKDMTPAILKDYGSIYKREGDISPTLPTGTDNPILNVFGVERGFTRSPAGPQEAPTMEQPEMPDTFRDSIQKAVASALVQRPDTKEYTIKAGDTLSEIAEREGTTVKALADMNDIPESDVDMIRAGETLKIPAKKEIRASTRGQGLMSPDIDYDTDLPAFGINSREFNDDLLEELVDLEGRGGDFLSSTPTYDLGITEQKANEYDLDPDDYETFGDFAKDFTREYVDEKYEENKSIFSKVNSENHKALMSYLWNLGSFGRKQKAALKKNDMREFIAEMKDAIGSEGFSSSGLSARRAKEANLIGENLDSWNPITKVTITGTRKNPTFTWEDADGNIVEQYSTTRKLHPANVPSKPKNNDVLNEEIIL